MCSGTTGNSRRASVRRTRRTESRRLGIRNRLPLAGGYGRLLRGPFAGGDARDEQTGPESDLLRDVRREVHRLEPELAEGVVASPEVVEGRELRPPEPAVRLRERLEEDAIAA